VGAYDKIVIKSKVLWSKERFSSISCLIKVFHN